MLPLVLGKALKQLSDEIDPEADSGSLGFRGLAPIIFHHDTSDYPFLGASGWFPKMRGAGVPHWGSLYNKD